MSRFQYQTIQVSGNDIVRAGAPSHHGEGLGAAADLALSATQALQDWAVRRQVNQAIDGLRPAVNQMLRSVVGVLICVAIEERARPGGAIERNFRTAFIAGSGRNAREALNEFIYGPRLWQTPPSGFTRRESFIWITSY
jgi:hypothetical protein